MYIGRFKRPEFDVVITHDENGFRKQEFQNKSDGCSHRILVFGDSFTWGWGVGQGEVFTDRMSLLMPSYCVYNYGVNAVGTAAEYILFDSEVKKLVKPKDTVVVMFYNNDFSDNLEDADIIDSRVVLNDRRKGPAKRPIDTRLKKISFFYNYVAYKINLWNLTRKRQKEIGTAQDLVALGEQDKRYIMETYFLKTFQDQCHELGADFLLVYIPGEAELAEASNLQKNSLANDLAYRKALFTITDSLHIRTLDLLPYFKDYKKRNADVTLTYKMDAHWNARGHALAARVLADHILEPDKGTMIKK